MDQPDDAIDEGEEVVLALTRPEELGGLPLLGMLVALYVPGFIALVTREPNWFFGVPVALAGVYLAALKDPHFFSVLWAMSLLRSCTTSHFWGCRRYAPR